MNARTDRHAHLDLLDQVADSADEARAVRRTFGVPLTGDELDTLERHKRAANYPIRYAACAHGPCDQGRKLCPTPQACQISAEPDAPRPPLQRGDGPLVLAGLLLAVAIVLSIAGVGL